METIVISLGGSLIVPNDVDSDFLKTFRSLVLEEVSKGRKFAIITGGGKICRKYNEAGLKIAALSNEDLDWLGIYSTRFNAEFVRLLFGDMAEKGIITDPFSKIELNKPVILGGGYKPGNSSDMAAIQIAKNIGAKKIINLSNTDFVYDSDPKVNPSAKKIEKISWKDYREIIPKEWTPGLSSPFDPIASAEAEKEGMEVVIMNGKPIDNLKNYLNNENFNGTVIS